jgi:MoxR-like ATPase
VYRDESGAAVGTTGCAIPIHFEPRPAFVFKPQAMSTAPDALADDAARTATWVRALREQIARVVVGQHHLIDRLLTGLLANGHVLLEGVPGLAKTLSVRTLAQAIRADFRRIQFTPDLLPADITGTLVYSPEANKYEVTRGPIFANLVLADEINRAPAKVQAALLEAMQERQVTLGGDTHPLPDPFLVLATENPIDQEGTYPLPEAQVDRFMLKVVIGYPSREEERRILDTMGFTAPRIAIEPVVSPAEILDARRLVDRVHIDDAIRDYIVRIVFATREPKAAGLDIAPYIEFGASPRATLSITLAAKAWAVLQGRAFVTPQDIKDIGPDVLRHRIILTYEADAENVRADDLVRRIFDTLPVP